LAKQDCAREGNCAFEILPIVVAGNSVERGTKFSQMTNPKGNDVLPAKNSDAKKIRVLIVDDSALIRALLTEIVSRQPDMVAVGAAADPLIAREMIRALNPDVLTLDVEMPRMDGLEFLEKLMALRPMPVVMVSTLTERGAETTMRALELGAIDFVTKPKIDIQRGVSDAGREIVDKIRIAATAKMRAVAPSAVPRLALAAVGNRQASTEKVIVVGASTGGTEAIKALLMQLPPDCPGMLIAQHMPAGFTLNFANRLDALCRIVVKEAVDAERVLPGHAYIAPGGRHLALDRSGANYVTRIFDTEPVNRHRPSVEVLFKSAAKHAGRNALGVMLTGMGKDGASAMRDMKLAGAHNVAQDEASCVVFGMPREAIAAGAIDEVLPLNKIAAHLLAHIAECGGDRFRI
jgi:two-component system, chemotaxis family, protein-glutamate methylesterase/glutaminase